MTDAPARPGAHAGAGRETLRSRLQKRVLWPLALTWLLGSSLAVAVAYVFTQRAFDRSLLDDAYTLAAQVGIGGDGELALNLSPHELEAVLFDQTERMFFAVLHGDGRLIAGHAGLPSVLPEGEQRWEFGDRHYRGLDLRVVTLRRASPREFVVVVGTTVRNQSLALQSLLAAAVVPQAVLLALLGWRLRRSINDELEPLARLQQALEQRDSADLSPLDIPAPSIDVTRLAEAASGLMARIGEGVQAQREFTGNVAHELRTPLAGIRSLAEYGLAQKDPAAWQAQLRLIVASEVRASHLVDQLLALALADEARGSLRLEPVAIDRLLHELVLRLLPRADAAGVDLGAAGLDEPLHALGTVALIEGLIGNLIDNALRYGRPVDGHAVPRVTVEASAAGAEVLVSVTDNGPGMAPELCEQALRRWEQGPPGAAQGHGFGLGLAIVSRYVTLLGGRLALGPADNGPGLRASVWLRAAPG